MPVFAHLTEPTKLGWSLVQNRRNGMLAGYPILYLIGYPATPPGECRQCERQTNHLEKEC